MILLPLMLAAVALVLFISYSYVMTATYTGYTDTIRNTARITNEFLEPYDLNDPEQAAAADTFLDDMCRLTNTEYMYVLKIDEQKSTIEYVIIGTGENASTKFISSRHSGDVISIDINEYMHNALMGNTEDTVERLKNKFGSTLICYQKRTGENCENEIIGVEISLSAVIDDFNSRFNFVAIISILSAIAFVIIFTFILHMLIQKPARIISQRMNSFVYDRKKGADRLEIKASREFTDIADSFNSMTEEIDRYVDELSVMNRQKAELNIARDIQKGLLEPPEYDNNILSVRAFMRPARSVGGDLYDYVKLDRGRICLIIADVSGKGVSAALFMSRAVTMLHQYAEIGMTPGEMLYEYNNHLAGHNPNMLFITTFVCIYDPNTNELVYGNAGHNFPFILSDTLIKLDGEQGMAAGIFNNQTYIEHTVKMKPGDVLFMYTDGVTEAKNSKGKLFSDEALEKDLSSLLHSPDRDVIPCILEHIEDFTREAEQADDITMLTLKINLKRRYELHLESKPENLRSIIDTIASLKLPDDTKIQLRFMAEEIFINICSYAYPDSTGTADIVIESDSEKAEMTFTDTGIPFDPTQNIRDIDDYDMENEIGGLGRYLTFTYADDSSYERKDGKNILKIIKYFKNP